MLSNAKLPKSFWAEAVSKACYLINRSPSMAIEKKTPLEVWSDTPGNYSELRIFGCPAYSHVDNGKLEPRSLKCIFLGFKPGVKGYKLWCPELKKVIVSRDVIFDEVSMLSDLSSNLSPDEVKQKSSMQVEVEIDSGSKSETSSQPLSQTQDSPVSMPSQPQYSIARDRPRREVRPPQRFAEADLVAYALNVAEDVDFNQEPSTYKEAVNCDDSSKWMIAMQEEMKLLHKNGT